MAVGFGSSGHHRLAYCTNVHAGATLELVLQNLERYACKTQSLLDPHRPLGVGLWLAEDAAAMALKENSIDAFCEWIREHRLSVFTMNGFPQGNFHQAVVKHRVYLPTWYEAARLQYTRLLVQILKRCLQPGQVGSISTLPIAWGTPRPSHDQLILAGENLIKLAEELHVLREESGQEIVLALEPEPGCLAGNSQSMREFFREYVLKQSNKDWVRRHLTICHDVCHAAVMQEIQAEELQAYRDMGLRIGKVQVSSAIDIDWDRLDGEKQQKALAQLGAFAEDRYLHQTSFMQRGQFELVEDLPQKLASVRDGGELAGRWRVHFHVPIFAEQLGLLGTTQQEILTCLKLLRGYSLEDFTGHWEVETYAWSVLPEPFAPSDLSEGIARELAWFEQQW